MQSTSPRGASETDKNIYNHINGYTLNRYSTQWKAPHCEGKAVWCFSFSLFCGILIPQGGLRSESVAAIIGNENAPAWRQPKPGRANPNREIKAGAVSIHHPAEKRKEKSKK